METKNLSKSNQTVLLIVGETGAGKTTLINSFANLFLPNKNNIKHVLVGNDKQKCSCHGSSRQQTNNLASPKIGSSDTEETSIYSIVDEEKKHELVLIDNPGLCDNRDYTLQKDSDSINSMLEKLAQSNIQYINGFLIAVTGTEFSRENKNLNYFLKTLVGLVPKELTANIIFIFTKVSAYPNSASIEILNSITNIPIQKSKNSFFFENLYFDQAVSLDFKNIEADDISIAKAYWNRNQQSFKALISAIEQLPPIEYHIVAKHRKMKNRLREIIAKAVEMLESFHKVRILDKNDKNKKHKYVDKLKANYNFAYNRNDYNKICRLKDLQNWICNICKNTCYTNTSNKYVRRLFYMFPAAIPLVVSHYSKCDYCSHQHKKHDEIVGVSVQGVTFTEKNLDKKFFSLNEKIQKIELKHLKAQTINALKLQDYVFINRLMIYLENKFNISAGYDLNFDLEIELLSITLNKLKSTNDDQTNIDKETAMISIKLIEERLHELNSYKSICDINSKIKDIGFGSRDTQVFNKFSEMITDDRLPDEGFTQLMNALWPEDGISIGSFISAFEGLVSVEVKFE